MQTTRWCYMPWTQLPTVQWSFISILHTQILVVPLRRCPDLCVKTLFVFTTGDNHRVIGLRPIASALGSVKLAALPAFTGRFSVKGKLLCWKMFMDAGDTITVLGSLGATVLPPRRDIGPCGEVYKPSLSAWNRYLKSQGTKMAYMYVQKKITRNRIGFHQNKGHFMKQFSSPTIKMIVWNNGKVCCPSLPQPDGFDGRKGRINGSPL